MKAPIEQEWIVKANDAGVVERVSPEEFFAYMRNGLKAVKFLLIQLSQVDENSEEAYRWRMAINALIRNCNVKWSQCYQSRKSKTYSFEDGEYYCEITV